MYKTETVTEAVESAKRAFKIVEGKIPSNNVLYCYILSSYRMNAKEIEELKELLNIPQR